jgi:hypothetical protein
MADSQKKLALAALAAALTGATGVVTVVTANMRIDMDLRLENQLPLVQIIPTTENVSYEVGFVAVWGPQVEVTAFFLANDEEESAREAIRQSVLNALGADPTLNGTCADCRVQSIVSRGDFPLFEELFSLEIIFERHRANA